MRFLISKLKKKEVKEIKKEIKEKKINVIAYCRYYSIIQRDCSKL